MKRILIIIFTIFLIFLLSINSFSLTDTEEIWENIDDVTRTYLDELGINEISFDKLFEITPLRVIEFMIQLALNKTVSLSRKFINILIILILSSIASSILKETNNLNKIIDYISILIIMSLIMDSIGRMLTDAATSIKNSMIFINTYIPIMTGIIVASKNPGLAITYNSFSIFISNIIAVFSDKIFVPLISFIFSLNITSSFAAENFQMKIISTLRRLIIIILSLFSTIYTGLLTTQSILARSSDSIALKGIRFISGTFIPIVGGNVGDAISSVLSSFLIMKNTLGTFIIIVIILINVPVMIEMLIWYFFFSFCSIFSSLLSIKNITEILDSLSSTIALLNIISFFITFILIISTGIIIVMGK